MSRVFGPAKARATVKTNITAKAKNPGRVIIMCSLVLLCMFCVFLRIFVLFAWFCMFSRVFGGFCALGVILDARGALLGILGSILAAFGTLLGALGALLAALGALLGALGALLEPCWPYLANKHRKTTKKPRNLNPTWEAKWSQNH